MSPSTELMWQGTWGQGWTHLMEQGGIPSSFLAYNAATGEVHFDRIHADGKGYDILMQSKWGPGWTHFIPCSVPGSCSCPRTSIVLPANIAFSCPHSMRI
jgi:hypothetical protein